ncbi:polysaccharide deacetylase family protein [Teredinibacter sp. KSP-S5-2]|uniref:polysaccharide deacetylase family protein n=1 Tax=Teredinibacter sp. KSP-S5-2 TaxID=3034506 RepID=UPI002934BB88|nr:polysaccharide deacetylase family protein [Teredinibacter sp. KSP-S5-2]WNO07537.1 polysaccharide deacetylase family protein [Teredinibacter sp. KSP-S5-2]
MRFFILMCAIWFVPDCHAQQIALTFDDAPMPGTSVMTGEERTKRIISALKESNVPDALFFVTAQYLSDTSAKRLTQYADAGFHLANHSFSHTSANKISAEGFLSDARKAHSMIKLFSNQVNYFRFPYLHHGDSKTKRKVILDGLDELGYRVGYVTVDNFDWYVNSLYVTAMGDGKKLNIENLKRLYVDVLWACIQFYDAVAVKALGKSPKHVLLLHENDLAALFLPDLIAKIRQEGWQIISPLEAYNEPLLSQYGREFDFNKQGRVAAIAYMKGVPEELLRHPSENTEYLDRLLKEYAVIQ